MVNFNESVDQNNNDQKMPNLTPDKNESSQPNNNGTLPTQQYYDQNYINNDQVSLLQQMLLQNATHTYNGEYDNNPEMYYLLNSLLQNQTLQAPSPPEQQQQLPVQETANNHNVNNIINEAQNLALNGLVEHQNKVIKNGTEKSSSSSLKNGSISEEPKDDLETVIIKVPEGMTLNIDKNGDGEACQVKGPIVEVRIPIGTDPISIPDGYTMLRSLDPSNRRCFELKRLEDFYTFQNSNSSISTNNNPIPLNRNVSLNYSSSSNQLNPNALPFLNQDYFLNINQQQNFGLYTANNDEQQSKFPPQHAYLNANNAIMTPTHSTFRSTSNQDHSHHEQVHENTNFTKNYLNPMKAPFVPRNVKPTLPVLKKPKLPSSPVKFKKSSTNITQDLLAVKPPKIVFKSRSAEIQWQSPKLIRKALVEYQKSFPHSSTVEINSLVRIYKRQDELIDSTLSEMKQFRKTPESSKNFDLDVTKQEDMFPSTNEILRYRVHISEQTFETAGVCLYVYGLKPKQKYTVRVLAFLDGKTDKKDEDLDVPQITGCYSDPSEFVTLGDKPEPPMGLVFMKAKMSKKDKEYGILKFSLKWNPPEIDNGEVVDKFRLEYTLINKESSHVSVSNIYEKFTSIYEGK